MAEDKLPEDDGKSLPPGPRVVMEKHHAWISPSGQVTRLEFVSPDDEFEIYTMSGARWDVLGNPEKIEVRLEAF